MQRTKSFTTAAFRRREHPVVWDIDGTKIHLIPSADIAAVANLIDTVRADAPDGLTVMQGLVQRQAAIIGAIQTFIEPDDHGAWAELASSFDSAVLGEMTEDLLGEYTGSNPTKPGSSSGGSDETGSASTDGAPAEASTPSL